MSILTDPTQGLTYADLDVLFENKVSARKFRKVEVDPFRSDNLVVLAEEYDSDKDGRYGVGHLNISGEKGE